MSTFTRNFAVIGAVVFSVNGTLNIVSSSFIHNNASYNGVVLDMYNVPLLVVCSIVTQLDPSGELSMLLERILT